MTLTFKTIQTQQVNGSGLVLPLMSGTSGAGTAAAAISGAFNLALCPNIIGTTLPTTIVGFQTPAGLADCYLINLAGNSSSSDRAYLFARCYLFGTANLAATPVAIDCFTHNAATFPVTRTIYGAATQAVPLIPFMYLTAAAATSAPVFILKTTAGGNGYANQLNVGVTGTKSFTCPSATTAIQSGYILRLENGDSAVTDIIQMSLTTRGTAGTANIYGIEPLMPLNISNYGLAVNTAIFTGIMPSITPAVATSGTATSFLTIIAYNSAASTFRGFASAVLGS